MTFLYSILATLLVSGLSLIGLLFINQKTLSKSTRIWVAFAAGALIADVFFHILPEVI
jgi:zinc transporter ZupT